MFATLSRAVALSNKWVLSEALRERLDEWVAQRPQQADIFGLQAHWVGFSLWFHRFLYEHYFRVDSSGIESVPANGPVIFTPNHGGTIPLDGIMLYQDILRRSQPIRLARPVADYFVPKLPFISAIFARVGVVAGSRANLDYLLQRGESLMLFPEGLPGIAKTYGERYTLQRWRPGHIELALNHRAAIVPVGIVGPDEQMPLLTKLESFKAFGVPYLPITATPWPLPVRYHIRYGEPVYPHEILSRSQQQDPAAIQSVATLLQGRVRQLIQQSLLERKGVFK